MKKILLSILIVALATGIQLYFWPYIEPAPSLLFYPTIILGCLLGNGIITILLSALSMQYFFILPYYSLAMTWPSDFLRQGLFIICAVSIKILVDRMKDSVRKIEEERKNRELFISTLAHDLRTPLTAAKLKAELISKYSMDEQIQKQSIRITANLSRADKLIQNILDVSRIKAGEKILLEDKECDLTKLVKECLEELTGIYGDRFVFNGPPELNLCLDKDGIQRIIENLCSNAVKYGDQNAIHIDLKDENNFIILSVHNTGSVIPKNRQKDLFDAYKQIESTAGGKIGWGLGLALVKGIAESHGGHVTIESSEAKGTTFSVYLRKR